MNLAVSSLIIFLIVSPAILARRIYYTKELSKSFVSRNTLQEIFSAIFLSFLLHFVWILVVEMFGYDIDFKILLKLLFNPDAISDYSNITSNVEKIFIYFITLSIISVITGYLFRNFIRVLKVDRRKSIFRYDNKWFYIFSGEVLDIKEYNKDKTVTSDKIDIKVVDVLTKSDDKNILYTGTLVDYQLNDNNSVDFIVLASPKKAFFDGSPSEEINSNYFIIPYSEILNINIIYFHKEN